MPQSLANVLLHLVFSTKGHEPFLSDAEIRSRACAYITGICKTLDSYVIAANGTENHLHILFAISRKHSIAEIVREIKSKSSKWIKEEFKTLSEFAWQSGYGIFSVSQSKRDQVVRYIQNQEEHHRKTTFKDEFRKLLELHGIEFDEKYVWD
ncbi:MAG: IS200/IS605 family transposase [Planctomycetota bacterium]|jgi:REP element-mobilizing transposase RayT